MVVATRIAGQIARPVYKFQGETLSVTASMGIAEVADSKQASSEYLVKAADVALYEAKRTGRSKIVVFDERMLIEPSPPE